jgi:hypothetical protein
MGEDDLHSSPVSVITHYFEELKSWTRIHEPYPDKAQERNTVITHLIRMNVFLCVRSDLIVHLIKLITRKALSQHTRSRSGQESQHSSQSLIPLQQRLKAYTYMISSTPLITSALRSLAELDILWARDAALTGEPGVVVGVADGDGVAESRLNIDCWTGTPIFAA